MRLLWPRQFVAELQQRRQRRFGTDEAIEAAHQSEHVPAREPAPSWCVDVA